MYIYFLSPYIYESQDSRERGRPFITPLYNLHLLIRRFNQTITAESSSLHIVSDQTQPETFGFEA